MIVTPLCITPLPVIIHVPLRMFVMVEGNSNSFGECVVRPRARFKVQVETEFEGARIYTIKFFAVEIYGSTMAVHYKV